MPPSLDFTVIPEKRYGFFKVDGLDVPAGSSIGQVISSRYPNVVGKTPPAGKKYVLTVTIRGYMEDVP